MPVTSSRSASRVSASSGSRSSRREASSRRSLGRHGRACPGHDGKKIKGISKMKLTFSPASPFARKVRIAAIETGLIDRIELVPTSVVPGQPNDEYSNLYPLKKLPALITDNGDIIVDSYVIVEYLDELAGGGKLIPTSGPTR